MGKKEHGKTAVWRGIRGNRGAFFLQKKNVTWKRESNLGDKLLCYHIRTDGWLSLDLRLSSFFLFFPLPTKPIFSLEKNDVTLGFVEWRWSEG